jgi:hypothetical protein
VTIQELEVHVAALLGILGFCVSLYVAWKDRRVVSIRAQWRWNGPSSNQRPKLLTVFVVNQKPRPVTIRYVILEATDEEGKGFKQAIWREGARGQTGRLAESEYVWADYVTTDWSDVRNIYAIDASRKRWYVPSGEIRSVRNAHDPEGTVEEFGVSPLPTK